MTEMPMNSSLSALSENTTSETFVGGRQTGVYVLQVFLALIIILGNGLIILTVLVSKRLRAPVYWLTMNVAAADLLMGIAILLRQVIFITGVLRENIFECIPSTVAASWAAIWSLCGLCLLSFERLLTVISPPCLQWFCKRNGQPIKIMAVVIALVSAFFASLSPLFVQRAPSVDDPYCVVGGRFVHSGYWVALGGTINVLVFCFIGCHSYTLIHAKRSLRELREAIVMRANPFDKPLAPVCNSRRNSRRVSVIGLNTPQMPGIESFPEQRKGSCTSPEEFELRYALMNMRITMVVTVVLVIMVVCWLPEMFMFYTVHGCGPQCGFHVDIFPWTGTLVVLNSMINIVVYSVRLRHFRREMWAVVKCMRRQEVTPLGTSRRNDDVISVIATGHPSNSVCDTNPNRDVASVCQTCSPSEVTYNLMHMPRHYLVPGRHAEVRSIASKMPRDSLK